MNKFDEIFICISLDFKVFKIFKSKIFLKKFKFFSKNYYIGLKFFKKL